jgi:hypothetical protein
VRWFLAAAVLLAGCATSPARSPTAGAGGQYRGPTCGGGPCDEHDTDAIYAKLRSVDAELHTIDAQPARPDCNKVNELIANIWACVQFICQIAEQQSPASFTHDRCRDSKARYQNAVERAQARGCWKK